MVNEILIWIYAALVLWQLIGVNTNLRLLRRESIARAKVAFDESRRQLRSQQENAARNL